MMFVTVMFGVWLQGMIWQRALASIFPRAGPTGRLGRSSHPVSRIASVGRFGFRGPLPGLKLLGTDMCDEKIEIARNGEYPWYSLKAGWEDVLGMRLVQVVEYLDP